MSGLPGDRSPVYRSGVAAPFRISVEADDLARVMGNALAFFPARSPVKTALLSVWSDTIVATGTDTYTLGRDECPARSLQTTDDAGAMPLCVELDRTGWRDIEAAARKDKKNTGVLEYRPGDSLTYVPGEEDGEQVAGQDATGTDTTFLVGGEDMARWEVWALCDELLTRMNETPNETPDRLTFDPALFGRFQKVKLAKSVKAEKVLDFVWQGQGSPMLARVGPTFVGMIMPIDRRVYEKNQPDSENMTWD